MVSGNKTSTRYSLRKFIEVRGTVCGLAKVVVVPHLCISFVVPSLHSTSVCSTRSMVPSLCLWHPPCPFFLSKPGFDGLFNPDRTIGWNDRSTIDPICIDIIPPTYRSNIDILSREAKKQRDRAAADATCFDTSGDRRTCTGAHATARVAKAHGKGQENFERTWKLWDTAKSTWIARKTASKVERLLTRKNALHLLCGRRMGILTYTRRRVAMEDVVLRPGGVSGGLGPFAMAPPGMKRRPDGGFEKVKFVS